MASWPSTLPQPNCEGYGLAPASQTLRTDMDAGAPRMRRRTSARNDHITARWVFTDAQMAAFRTWFESPTDGAGGASWFTVLLPIGTGDQASVDARFVDTYKADLVGKLMWQVSAELEVR